MIKTSVLQLQLNCPGCNSYHAVSSIDDYDTCQNCGRQINISEVLFEKMIGMTDRTHYINAFLSGNVEQMGGSGAYKLVYNSMPAYCEECKTVIEEKALINSIEKSEPFTCQSCSHTMPVRSAENTIKRFHPKSLGILNDSKGVDRSQKNSYKDLTMVFSCMSCGGTLELTNKTNHQM